MPFARSIDGHLAHHSLQALTLLRLRRKGGITKLIDPLLVVLVSVRMLVQGR